MKIQRIAILFAIAGLAACQQAVTPVRTSCAEWRGMPDGQRVAIASAIVTSAGLADAVRVAQHDLHEPSDEDLFRAAAGSVTKSCDLSDWPADTDVARLVEAIYRPYSN
jgi:hypothetical protein